MLGLFYPYGFLLQAIAILHFVRRRPDTYWLWIILMGGALGALVYIAIEVVPDAGLLRGAFQVFPRRKRIKELEAAILDNPSVGNYEELGALYRRGLCEIALDDYTAAATDLQHVTERDPKYDYQRAAGLHAHALAKIGERASADALFAEVTETSTLSETQYNYGCFLASEGRSAEAREWAERILRKKATMPDYIRRRERPWFRKAK